MKRKLMILLIILVTVAFGGFIIINTINNKSGKNAKNEEAELSFVTSFYPTYIIALNITDQIPEIMVESLTDFSAGCLHDYQLTTGDMRLLSTADLFLMNGGGMEGYLEDVVKNYPKLEIIDISREVPMIDSDEHAGEPNPHVWLDPVRYMKQIKNMEDGLINYIKVQDKLSEEAKDSIVQKLSTNAEAYLDKVSALEEDLSGLLKDMEDSQKNKKVVIFHEAFAYLADRVGLEVAHTVEMDGDTALSAGEIAKVIDMVKKDQIEYLFTEKQYGNNITNRIEEETSATAYIIDSAVTGDGTKDSYLNAMKKNLEILKTAFK